MIAAEVGYPSSERQPPGIERLIEVDRRRAAELMAFFSSVSLAYGSYKVKEGPRRQAVQGLKDLTDAARFFTNGTWLAEANGGSWAPLSDATFDGGVIGFDDDCAFIYWVEEED